MRASLVNWGMKWTHTHLREAEKKLYFTDKKVALPKIQAIYRAKQEKTKAKKRRMSFHDCVTQSNTNPSN